VPTRLPLLGFWQAERPVTEGSVRFSDTRSHPPERVLWKVYNIHRFHGSGRWRPTAAQAGPHDVRSPALGLARSSPARDRAALRRAAYSLWSRASRHRHRGGRRHAGAGARRRCRPLRRIRGRPARPLDRRGRRGARELRTGGCHGHPRHDGAPRRGGRRGSSGPLLLDVPAPRGAHRRRVRQPAGVPRGGASSRAAAGAAWGTGGVRRGGARWRRSA
jgi:hypothetical protein